MSFPAIDLPAGASRFFRDMTKALRCTFDDAVEHLCSNSIPLKRYLAANVDRRIRYRETVANVLQVKIEDISSLSSESHLDGSSVCRDRASGKVLYSSRRAIPELFFDLSRLFADELGCPIFGRDITISKDFAQRPFIPSSEIKDVSVASSNAGYLLALAWCTSTTDLHSGNIVFFQDVPYVLDDECVCHSLRQEQLRVLESTRRHYPYSPFRTVLIQERHLEHRKAESGFNVLLKAGIDHSKFCDAVFEGLNLFRKRSELFIEAILECVEQQGMSRYLARGTEFYDLCIYQICNTLSIGNEGEIDGVISKMFLVENDLFPNLRACVPSEISALKRGDVPYILMSMIDGQLVNESTGGSIGKVISVPKWMALHTSRVLALEKSTIEEYLSEVGSA